MNGLVGLKFICELPTVLPARTFRAMDTDLTKFLGVEVEYEIKKATKNMYDSHGFNVSEGDFYLQFLTVGYKKEWNTDTIAVAIEVIKRHIDLNIYGEFLLTEETKPKKEEKRISDEEYEKMIKDLAKNIIGKRI